MAKTSFSDGDKSQGIKGTRVTAAFLNAINNHVHDGADADGHVPKVKLVELDPDVTDLLQAASTTVAGRVELATSAETQIGTDASRAVTPEGLLSCFSSSPGTTGHIKLPGGFIIQWGVSGAITEDTSVYIDFSIPFPEACLVVIPAMLNSSTSNDDVFPRVISETLTQVRIRAEATGALSGTRYVRYIAIGR